MDLLEYDYMDREFSVLNGKYVFKFEKKKGMFISEMEVWMRRNNLFWADTVFKLQQIETLEDIHRFDPQKVTGEQYSKDQVIELDTIIKLEVEKR